MSPEEGRDTPSLTLEKLSRFPRSLGEHERAVAEALLRAQRRWITLRRQFDRRLGDFLTREAVVGGAAVRRLDPCCGCAGVGGGEARPQAPLMRLLFEADTVVRGRILTGRP